MTITTRDQFQNAMLNNQSTFTIDKATMASQTAQSYCSMWRATGQPGQGAIPTAAAVCDETLVGSIGVTQQTSPVTSYLGLLEMTSGNNSMAGEIHDRLMHMGGLSGTVTTAQTVNLDVHANIGTNNLDARKGDANYSDIKWFMEWFTATGATSVTATINVTYNNGTSGNLTALTLTGSRPAGHMILLNSLIPAADSGKFIRDINTVTLSATTGTAGNFGFTACRFKGRVSMMLAGFVAEKKWDGLSREVPNKACLFPVVFTSTTSSGYLRGDGIIAHG